MGIERIANEWSRLLILTHEQAQNLVHIEHNKVYQSVVYDYAHQRTQDPKDPYTFYDVLYWLDYEANMDRAQNTDRDDWAYDLRSINGINKWLHKYYPDYAKDSMRPWGCY